MRIAVSIRAALAPSQSPTWVDNPAGVVRPPMASSSWQGMARSDLLVAPRRRCCCCWPAARARLDLLDMTEDEMLPLNPKP